MRVNIKMFGESDHKLAVPSPIFRMREWSTKTLGEMMWRAGISKLTLKVTTDNLFPAVSIGYEACEEEPPSIIKSMVPDIVRAARLLMPQWGITEVQIKPSESEREALNQYWHFIDTGEISNYNPDDIELPEIIDPVTTDKRALKIISEKTSGDTPEIIDPEVLEKRLGEL